MQDAFRLGGWGMYPTLFVGAVLVIVAIRYAMSPARGRLGVVVGLGTLTMLTGTLGFVTGVIRTLIYAGEQPNPGAIAALGIGESLHNIGLALVLGVIAGIATVVGLTRRSGDSRADLVDPHTP